MGVSYSELPPGTSFEIVDTSGNVFSFLSRGAGRTWLDCTLNGEPAVLVAFDIPFNKSIPYDTAVEKFRGLVQARGGLNSARYEIGEGMTAQILWREGNYFLPVRSAYVAG